MVQSMVCNYQAAGIHQAAWFIDPQTEADRSSQCCIVYSLQKQFPNVHIIGEEVAAIIDICIINFQFVCLSEMITVVVFPESVTFFCYFELT